MAEATYDDLLRQYGGAVLQQGASSAEKEGSASYDDLLRQYGGTVLPQPGAAPQEKPKATAPVKSGGDLISSSFIRGAANVAGLPGSLLDLITSGIGKAGAAITGNDLWRQMAKPEVNVSPSAITGAVEKVAGPLYRPQGDVEKRVGAGIEGAVGGAVGGPAAALFGAAGNVAGEVADSLSPGSPYAKPAVSTLTTLALQTIPMLRGAPGRILNDATQGIDQSTFNAAQALIAEAQKRGIRLTPAEALGQVQGTNNTPLLNMQRVVEQSRGGNPIMAQAMAERPGQIRAASDVELNKLGPQVADPTALAGRVQTAATGALDDARMAGNAQAKPYYAAAENQVVPSGTINTVAINHPMIVEAANKVVATTKYGVFGENPYSVKALDAAKKYIDDVASSAKQAGANNEARVASGALGDLLARVDNQVPAYQLARAIIQSHRKNVMKPMESSPLGGLSKAADTTQQRSALFGMIDSGTERQVANTIKSLNSQDAYIANDFTRQYLADSFNKSAKDLQTGANQFGGAKFAAAITGNDQQAKNLRTVVETMNGGGKATWEGFDNFLEVLRATGKRQPAGSQTAQNTLINQEMGNSGLLVGALKTASSPQTLLASRGDSIITRWQQNANGEALANILLDPQGLNKIRALSRLSPESPRAKALVISIIGAQDNKQGQQ